MFAEFLILFVVFLATAVVYLITYARKHYGELEALGIPVVKPHFFLGSSPNFTQIIAHEQDLEWFMQHGDVFGVYDGRTPNVFVCDPDIVKQIMIKDFDHFRNHSFQNLLDEGHILSEMLDFLNDDKWKAVRSLMSPTFTTSKLKKINVVMKEAAEGFVKVTKEELTKSPSAVITTNIYDDMFALLTDMTARVTLNIKIDNPKDPNNDFAQAIKGLFSANPPPWVLPYTRAFPFLNKYLSGNSIKKETDFFTTVFRKVMSERKKSGQRQDDFVDFLNDFNDKTENAPELKKLGIKERTVIANAVEFYIAGQDSMSAAFAMVIYYMKKDPEVEKKLYEEIDAHAKKHGGKVDQDTLGDLPYLHACLTEALRLHPTFHRLERLCNKDWEYKGLTIKKGMTVVFPLWPYHRNPKYFPDPEKFDPERFMPSNKDNLDPLTFASFGHGPRMCIGNRFSMQSLAIISAYILQNFQFKSREDTEIVYYPGSLIAAIMGPINMDISLRPEAPSSAA